MKIPGGIVLALHPGKHRVAAGLHGKVELGAKVGEIFNGIAEFFCNA